MDLEASGCGLALAGRGAGSGAPQGRGSWIIRGSAASQPPRLHTACCTCRPGVPQDDRHLPGSVLSQSIKNSCYESEPALSLPVRITPTTGSRESGGHVSSPGNTLLGGNATSERKTV